MRTGPLFLPRLSTARLCGGGAKLAVMPCDVHFVSGGKLTLDGDAEIVAARLAHGKLECFEQPAQRPDVWINPANVLYVEPRGENPAEVGFA